MDLLSVQNLNKKYPGFELKNVSFALEKGYIMGFIGRNGAGKTTTLKAMLNLVHRDSGSVSVLGQDYLANELTLSKRSVLCWGGHFITPGTG